MRIVLVPRGFRNQSALRTAVRTDSNGAASASTRAVKSAGGVPTTSRVTLRTASPYHLRHAEIICPSCVFAVAGSLSAAAIWAPSRSSVATRAFPALATSSATDIAIDASDEANSHAVDAAQTPTFRISAGLVLSGVSKLVW